MRNDRSFFMGHLPKFKKRPFTPLLLFILPFLMIGLGVQAQPPTVLTAGGWAITNVAASGVDGFTNLNSGRVGDNGRIVVSGTRNGSDGLFIVEGGIITEVATAGLALPGGLGNIDFINDFNITPQGNVLFTADVSGGSLPASPYAFRWNNGTITQQQPATNDFVHHITKLTSDGRWLAEQITGTPPNFSSDYRLTNGTTDQAIFSFNHTGGSCVFHSVNRQMTTPNANDTIVYYEETSTRAFSNGFCVGDTLVEWSLKLAGAANNTVTSGSNTLSGNSQTGTEADFNNIMYLNNNDETAWVRTVYHGISAATQELVISQAAGGEQILLDTTGTVDTIFLGDFDNEGRVVLQVMLNDFSSVILGGSSLSNDAIIHTGDTLFGQTVSSFSLLSNAANAPTGTFGDNRNIVFSYTLQDNTTGIAVASKGVTRWTNPNGGNWTTAANWSPATVPDSTTETVFDLDNSYDVTVGTRQSGRSRVEAGSVLFQSANLTLTGPFSVGGAAHFSLPTGSITASDLIVGHLPPTNPASPPTAHVTISNDGTVFTAGAQTIVGQAGEGDLFVNDGRLNSGEALIGKNSAGTATVGGTNALWQITSLDVGAGFTATLNIESGGQVQVNNAAVIGQADTLQNHPARITVDNAGVPLTSLSNFGVVNDLTIGDALPGTLDIRNGGVVAVLGLLQVGVQAHNQRLPDAVIVINGTDGVGTQASNLFTSNDALLGMGDGTQAEWLLTNGGQSTVSGNLHLGHTAGSSAALMVSGFNTDGLRSKMEAGTGSEVCRVGFDGEGSAEVRDGGLLACQNMNIGGNVGSTGNVLVTGQRGAVASTLQVANVLCIGGAPVCGSGTNVAGTLTLQNNGLVKTDTLLVANEGHLLGQGAVQANFGIIAGEVAPGLGLPALAVNRGLSSLSVIQPSTLVISGSVTLSETAVISLNIHALTNYDQLVIDGPVQLDGQLVLNFGEGFAPSTGDVFQFIQADSATGDFADVVVTGLADGFDYNLIVTNGVITLTALNDGVSTTEPSKQFVFLPVVLKP